MYLNNADFFCWIPFGWLGFESCQNIVNEATRHEARVKRIKCQLKLCSTRYSSGRQTGKIYILKTGPGRLRGFCATIILGFTFRQTFGTQRNFNDSWRAAVAAQR